MEENNRERKVEKIIVENAEFYENFQFSDFDQLRPNKHRGYRK